MEKLTDQQRVKRYLKAHSLTHADAAGIMGTTPATVQVSLSRKPSPWLMLCVTLWERAAGQVTK